MSTSLQGGLALVEHRLRDNGRHAAQSVDRLVDEVAQSTAGRRWLPELAERQDALEPERVGRLVVELASGRADALSGRFLHVLDDLDDLIARAEQISRDDRYALRFQV